MIKHEAALRITGTSTMIAYFCGLYSPTFLVSEDIFCTIVKRLKTRFLDKILIPRTLFGVTTAGRKYHSG